VCDPARRQADAEIPSDAIEAGIAIVIDWLDENRFAIEAGGDGGLDGLRSLVGRLLLLKIASCDHAICVPAPSLRGPDSIDQ
jgi:hypothetical protein